MKKYRVSFLVGLGSGLVVSFLPSLISPVGYFTEKLANGFKEVFPFLGVGFVGIALSYLIFCLPFFLVFMMTKSFRMRLRAEGGSFLFFLFGVIVVAVFYVGLVFFALSQSELVW